NPPPPTHTLSPYTTLFRSKLRCRARPKGKSIYETSRPSGRAKPDRANRGRRRRTRTCILAIPGEGRISRSRHPSTNGKAGHGTRSEEHTSELQSLTNLVCR